jgi:phage-related minor tail protein
MSESIGTARLDVVVGTEGVDAGVSKITAATRDMSKAAKDASTSMEQNSKRQVASLEKQIATLGKSKDEIIRWRIEQQTSGKVAADLAAKLDAQVKHLQNSGKALNAYGISAKQTAAALRGVPAQITDIAVALQSGQRPLTVLLQQGGQLKDMFGGIIPAARALGGAILGLVNPYTIAAVAAGGLLLAWKQGADEVSAFNRALDLSGNVAGTTAQRLQGLSATLVSSTATQHDAAAALAAVAQSGKFTAEQMGAVAQAALAMQAATGQAVEQTITEFSKLTENPVQAAAELNKQVHFLTSATFEHIKALQEEGRTQEAATLLIDEFSRVSTQRAQQAVADADAITKAWRAVKQGISGAIDELRNFGRLNTVVGVAQHDIAGAVQQLHGLEQMMRDEASKGKDANLGAVNAANARIKELTKLISDSQKVLRADPQMRRAAIEAANQRANDTSIALQSELGSYATQVEKLTREKKRVQTQSDAAIADATKAGNLNLVAQIKANEAQLVAAIDKEIASTAKEPKVKTPRIGRVTTARVTAIPDFSKDAANDLQKQAEAEDRATQSFLDMQAALDGPLAQAEREHAKRVAELNQLAAQSPIAAAGLTDALNAEAQAHQKNVRAIQAELDPLGTLLDDMRFELQTIGLSNTQRAVMIELRRNHIDVMSQEAQAALATANAFDAEAKSKQTSINLMDDFRQGASNALTEFVTGAKSAKDALKDFFDELAAQITKAIADQWIQKLFGQQGTSGGGTSGGGWIAGLASIFSSGGGEQWYANGGAFDSGVQKFAYGGVVSSPTNFGMSGGRLGLMGEAGPEAILPLHRGPDGKLGVRMEAANQPTHAGPTVVHQQVYVQGRPDSRTPAQFAQATAREQNRASARNR